MAEAERSDERRKFLNNAETRQRFSDLYEAEVKLLNEAYFKHNTYEPGKR